MGSLGQEQTTSIHPGKTKHYSDTDIDDVKFQHISDITDSLLSGTSKIRYNVKSVLRMYIPRVHLEVTLVKLNTEAILLISS